MHTQTIRPLVVEDLFARIWNAGCITDSQKQRLVLMSIERVLSDNEREALDRLFHAIRRGWLKVID
ncbi:hypothetical protein IQ235_03855 [Oscillatoriales cyanobacterium LEGE 11467]|uniref:Uncharacterized protein n=1 Tax=Zarconia navalis LEGE 11467 TaxID=1828826 RepID=A0A928Z8K0_9CYAN|nr:hypothetical protein [Zarconia navalis]MBE9039926.1 hypothetical protein [Zarconia navalis LEGE 11467]